MEKSTSVLSSFEICASRYINRKRQIFGKYMTQIERLSFWWCCSESENLTLAHAYTCRHKICACARTINCTMQWAQTCGCTVHVYKHRDERRRRANHTSCFLFSPISKHTNNRFCSTIKDEYFNTNKTFACFSFSVLLGERKNFLP